MVKKHVMIFLSLFAVSQLFSQNLPCEKVVDYTINVQLDPDSKILTGQETLLWTNRSETPVSSMRFHAYLNAFKNSQSTFMKEVYRCQRNFMKEIYLDKESWGYCDIAAITFNNIDVMPSFQYIHPDDDNQSDQTVFEIQLPEPVNPGETATLQIEFTSKLPRKLPRTGYIKNHFFAGQWFPKIGVWENGEWNCHQYHLNSEFYANFGDYHVSITAPQNVVIGATGSLADSTAGENGSKTLRFEQECVHDFAWTAWPDYKVAHKTFQHDGLPAVKMTLLFAPEHEKYVDDYFNAAANTLKYFGTWYTPYPYETLTIVDVPGKSWTGGMEYPTLFTVTVDLFTAPGEFHPEYVTIHECGHQFFYGLLASNEFEYPWLDEGFTVYGTSRCIQAAYGLERFSKEYLSRTGFNSPISFQDVQIDSRDWMVDHTRKRGMLAGINNQCWDFPSWIAYRNNAYEKPALMLWTLEYVLGDQVWSDIMTAYAERFRFRHPEPQDFIDIVNEFSPDPMDWFFDQLLYEPGVIDYAVTHVSSESLPAKKGFFGQGKDIAFQQQEAKEDAYLTTVYVERKGNHTMPVELFITLEDGDTILKQWDGESGLEKIQLETTAQIEKAEVDPQRKIWLDVNPNNNGKYASANHFASFRWTVRWMFWLQHFLETMAFFS